MGHVETAFTVHLPPATLYRAISHVPNLALYAPGVAEAELVEGHGGPGSLLDLTTKAGHQLYARVLEAEPPRRWTVEDERGVRTSWDLEPAEQGTLASLSIEGLPEDRTAEAVRSEVRAKVARLVLEVQGLGASRPRLDDA